ncbi:MAG: hypothetical protein DHS20C14_20700 [Phycisphaeraceae bacterium]|nr:MAG: hypothetical protein DHS20C14_20700 [Phycisphaeraceae bacterium]
MTRENKLALIIGFTLILMVGVLVSDHLSRARMARLDEAATAEGTDTAERVAFSGGLLDSAIDAAQQRGLNEQTPVATRIGAGTQTPAQAPVQTPSAPAPALIQQGANELAGAPATDAEGAELGDKFRAWAEATGTAWERWNASAVPPERGTTIPNLTVPADRPTGQSSGAPIARSVTHKVVANDSLYRLAERYLGNGNRWRELQKANAGTVGTDGALSLGMVLKIPMLEEVSMPRETVHPRAASGPSEYTVQPGDILGTIASELLGSARRADEIVAANRGVIDNADEIRVGMKLKIPAR